MQKLRFLLLLTFFPLALLAQKTTKITVVNAPRNRVDTKNQISYLNRPTFRQGNATFTCDSAVFYEVTNVVEAYNNVHINQADTVNIFSDRLTYNGNTKIAHLTNNVRLLDRQSVLTTNILDYNMGTKVGTYVDGGKIVNKDVTLTSKNGYYFSSTRDAYFRYNVIVVTPQVTIKSDTMRYNTLTNWTFFYGPTNIKGKDDNLYTENGAYNTKSEYAYFDKRNLYTQGSKSMKGDSLYYDGKAGYAKAVRNIVFLDTTDKTMLRGQLGFYYKKGERTVVTRNAYVGMGTSDSVMIKDVKRPDSLWLGADTLETQMVLRQTLTLIPRPIVSNNVVIAAKEKAPAAKAKSKSTAPIPVPTPKLMRDTTAKIVVPLKLDTVRTKVALKPLKPDSIGKLKIKPGPVINPLDTVRARIIKAYHHVKVYKSNLQALSDSLFYTSADSTLRWYNNPILWGDGSQQTADTIYLQMRNKKLSSVEAFQNAFSVNVEKDSTRFNQVKGRRQTGFFNDGKIKVTYIDGNAESIYFSKDKNDVYDNMTQTIGSRLRINFKNEELTNVANIGAGKGDAESKVTPINLLKENVYLTGFSWKPELRPRSKLDITNPKARKLVTPEKKPATGKTVPAGKAPVKVDKRAIVVPKPADTTARANGTGTLRKAPPEIPEKK
ncbi:MAG: hypothetical protein EOO88_11425 [Pedobacter sp.]|nr:MAG: hypothetical protein EOO88_11425 [Pedobacter sp.]